CAPAGRSCTASSSSPIPPASGRSRSRAGRWTLRRSALLLPLAVSLTLSCVHGKNGPAIGRTRPVAAPIRRRLVPFSSEGALVSYLRDLGRAQARERARVPGMEEKVGVMAETVTVAAAAAPGIPNVQHAGVDEGDIV